MWTEFWGARLLGSCAESEVVWTVRREEDRGECAAGDETETVYCGPRCGPGVEQRAVSHAGEGCYSWKDKYGPDWTGD